jgi:hypothetical protein
VQKRWQRQRAEETKAAIKQGGTTYLLGRAFARFRRPAAASEPSSEKGILFALGRAWRNVTSKK